MKKTFLAFSALFALTVSNDLSAQANWHNTINTGTHSTALGAFTQSIGSYSTALGFESKAVGHQSLAAGHWSRADGVYSFALGARARSMSEHTMAFGLDVRASGRKSMILGTGVSSSTPFINSVASSFMVGFNSDIPTLFVGTSSGAGTVGKVGVGTASPDANLHVKGSAPNPNIFLTDPAGRSMELGLADCSSCFSPHANSGDGVMRMLGGGNIVFSVPASDGEVVFDVGSSKAMTVKKYGAIAKVGIGTTNFPNVVGTYNVSAYRLYVRGGILTEELTVNSGWADYVFEDDYNLRPLSEVKAFIDENGHLPNVPSAAQVEVEGIQVGDMTRIQQEKIEELTLYIIEQQERLNQLAEEVELLKTDRDEEK